MRQRWETMTSISAGHIILTPTQPAGSGRPQRGSNPVPPDQESRALPTELLRPPDIRQRQLKLLGARHPTDPILGLDGSLFDVVQESHMYFLKSDTN